MHISYLRSHAFTIECSVGYDSGADVLEECKFQNARQVILYYEQSEKKFSTEIASHWK